MIDIATETIITLEDAAKRLVVSRFTVSRWVTNGSRGIKLEAIRVGGRWRTSVEALQRFAEAQTPCQEPTASRSGPPVPSVRSEKQRLRRAEAVDRQLDEMLGIRFCAKCDERIEWLQGSVPKTGSVWCAKCLVTRKSATFGQRVRTFRCTAFLSQRALSDRTGIAVDFLRAYEQDEKKPSSAHLAGLITTLGAELVSGLAGYPGGDREKVEA